ncbi:hypothetical protein BJ912DRAFT_1031165 [Pholiota molesta]|nr:hypothetical protein BJ912DRAFT_1031165 [Pholiota molesta]
MSVPPPFLSRFHAIVTAKSIDGTGPPIITAQPQPLRFEDPEKKRRREENAEAGPSNIATKPTKTYQSRDDLLIALRDRFRQGANVDFHGTYDIIDAGVTHKQRVQSVAHEIWKATGYRFTVKDHPQFINGHKTRFWKLQGDCYKPRVTSAGRSWRKTDIPAESLLISSRDSHLPGSRCITVRMHHQSHTTTNRRRGMVPTSEANGEDRYTVNLDTGMVEEDDSDVEREDDPLGTGYDAMEEDVTGNHRHLSLRLAPKLREFCDGLEYQLQFNDYRMLQVLEQEGGSFLNLWRIVFKKKAEWCLLLDLLYPSQATASFLCAGHLLIIILGR